MKKRVIYIMLFLFLLSTIIAVNIFAPFYLLPITIFVFIFLPGYLVIDIIDLKINLTKTIVFSIGISVVFLMVGGLVLDQALYFIGLNRPLDSVIFPITLILMIGVLLTLAYFRNLQDDEEEFKWEINFNLSEIFFLSLSIFLLVFVIFSSLYTRIHNSNVFLIIAYFFIVLIFFIFVQSKKISKKKYFLFLIIFGFCLVLPVSIRYNYIVGVDVFREYQLFKHIDLLGHWSVITSGNLMNALSINFFPVVVNRLTGISGMNIFRYLIPVIFSLSALTIFEISKNFLNEEKAFLAAFFYCASPYYLHPIYSPRTVLAIFFVSLFLLIFLDEKITNVQFQILFIICAIGLIISHYANAYLFLIALITLLIARILFQQLEASNVDYFKKLKNLHAVLYLLIIYIWLNLGSGRPFESGIDVFYSSFAIIFWGKERTAETSLGAQGTPVGTEIPYLLDFIVIRVVFILMLICAIYFIKRLLDKMGNYKERELLCLIIGGGLIPFSYIFIPGISARYSMFRAYIFAVCFMAPSFVIGCYILFRKKVSFGKYVVVIIVGIFLLSNAGVTYQIMGHQEGLALVTEGDVYLDNYVSRSEYQSAEWLDENRIEGYDVYTTELGENRRFAIAFNHSIDRYRYVGDISSYLDNETINEGFEGYVYLYKANVEYGVRRVDSEDVRGYIEFQKKDTLIHDSNLVYSNGHSIVLYGP